VALLSLILFVFGALGIAGVYRRPPVEWEGSAAAGRVTGSLLGAGVSFAYAFAAFGPGAAELLPAFVLFLLSALAILVLGFVAVPLAVLSAVRGLLDRVPSHPLVRLTWIVASLVITSAALLVWKLIWDFEVLASSRSPVGWLPAAQLGTAVVATLVTALALFIATARVLGRIARENAVRERAVAEAAVRPG
jgi:hypothetical protein